MVDSSSNYGVIPLVLKGLDEVTLGLSAGGPLSRTEVASSGLKSKPKERGG